MTEEQRPSFETIDDAYEWMELRVDDPCVDNRRFAFEDDHVGMEIYGRTKDGGCCGFFDADIIVDGRNAVIGCNYGH